MLIYWHNFKKYWVNPGKNYHSIWYNLKRRKFDQKKIEVSFSFTLKSDSCATNSLKFLHQSFFSQKKQRNVSAIILLWFQAWFFNTICRTWTGLVGYNFEDWRDDKFVWLGLDHLFVWDRLLSKPMASRYIVANQLRHVGHFVKEYFTSQMALALRLVRNRFYSQARTIDQQLKRDIKKI